MPENAVEVTGGKRRFQVESDVAGSAAALVRRCPCSYAGRRPGLASGSAGRLHRWTSVVVVTVAALLLSSRVADASPDAVWEQSSIVARQGDNVTLVCAVPNVRFFDVVRLTLTPSSMTASQQPWTVADNEVLRSPFAALSPPRYGTRFVVRDHIATITLQITGIQGEDSGRIGCRRLTAAGSENDAAEANVRVLVPVKEIYIAYVTPEGTDMRIEDGDDVTLTQSYGDGVACVAVVDGSSAAPQVEVTVGEDDETDAFNLTATSTPISAPPDGGIGPTHFRSVARLAYVTVDPNPTFNRRTMTCAAVQAGFHKVVAAAVINIRYAPLINCSGNQARARPGQTATISCIITANPSCDDVTWAYSGGDNVDDDLHADPNIRIIDRTLKGDASEASMSFRVVQRQHFQTYTLTATNDVGQRRVLVSLIRDQTPAVPRAPRWDLGPSTYEQRSTDPRGGGAGNGGAPSAHSSTSPRPAGQSRHPPRFHATTQTARRRAPTAGNSAIATHSSSIEHVLLIQVFSIIAAALRTSPELH